MKIKVLGCGTSTGVPMIGCQCPVCTSTDPRNRRMRSSIYITSKTTHVLVDTTPDLRFQALEFGITQVDAVIYTHTHADHLHGIDELRIFNFLKMGEIPIYSFDFHLNEITKRFSYIFSNRSAPGGGKPWLVPVPVQEKEDFVIGDLTFTPITIFHGQMKVMGIRSGDFAYLTDCNRIPDESYELLKGIRILIIDALRFDEHPTHFSLEEALAEIEKLKPEKAYLTHMSHAFDYETLKEILPPTVEPLYDGMEITL